LSLETRTSRWASTSGAQGMQEAPLHRQGIAHRCSQPAEVPALGDIDVPVVGLALQICQVCKAAQRHEGGSVAPAAGPPCCGSSPAPRRSPCSSCLPSRGREPLPSHALRTLLPPSVGGHHGGSAEICGSPRIRADFDRREVLSFHPASTRAHCPRTQISFGVPSYVHIGDSVSSNGGVPSQARRSHLRSE
jgi:hypothetical protein